MLDIDELKIRTLFGPVLVDWAKHPLSCVPPCSNVFKFTVKFSSQKSRLTATLDLRPGIVCCRRKFLYLGGFFLCSLLCSPELQEQIYLSVTYIASLVACITWDFDC